MTRFYLSVTIFRSSRNWLPSARRDLRERTGKKLMRLIGLDTPTVISISERLQTNGRNERKLIWTVELWPLSEQKT